MIAPTGGMVARPVCPWQVWCGMSVQTDDDTRAVVMVVSVDTAPLAAHLTEHHALPERTT